MKQSKFPPGWDEKRIREVLDYYESQTDEEAAAEHQTALDEQRETLVQVPYQLLPIVRELIARFQQEHGTSD